jgi:malonate decarboxylase epsilon subunit
VSAVFLFPGQGSQQPNMLHNLPQHPAVSETLDEASEVLNENVLLWDTKEALKSTVAVQVALLVAGVAAARALAAEGAQPDMVAGHSVGAFGAAVVANVIDFRDAVTLVKMRGELMERAYPQGYGMGVVLGIQERKLVNIVEKNFTDEEPVFIANRNSPDQITISGSIRGIERILALARKEGARKAELLSVKVPSHCRLLQSVSLELAAALKKIPFRRPDIPYAGNRTARALHDPEAIREDLALGVSHPVRWHEATSLLFEMGARLFIEMPPGRVLTDLAQNAFPTARAVSVSDSGVKTSSILVKREKTIEL